MERIRRFIYLERVACFYLTALCVYIVCEESGGGIAEQIKTPLRNILRNRVIVLSRVSVWACAADCGVSGRVWRLAVVPRRPPV